MKATFNLVCLLTVLAAGLSAGCSTLPSSVAPEQGSTIEQSQPPMVAPAKADRKTQGGRTGTTARMG